MSEMSDARISAKLNHCMAVDKDQEHETICFLKQGDEQIVSYKNSLSVLCSMDFSLDKRYLKTKPFQTLQAIQPLEGEYKFIDKNGKKFSDKAFNASQLCKLLELYRQRKRGKNTIFYKHVQYGTQFEALLIEKKDGFCRFKEPLPDKIKLESHLLMSSQASDAVPMTSVHPVPPVQIPMEQKLPATIVPVNPVLLFPLPLVISSPLPRVLPSQGMILGMPFLPPPGYVHRPIPIRPKPAPAAVNQKSQSAAPDLRAKEKQGTSDYEKTGKLRYGRLHSHHPYASSFSAPSERTPRNEQSKTR